LNAYVSAPTLKQYRKAVDDMLKQFEALPSVRGKARDQEIIEIAYAWAAQVYRFARAILVLADAGFEHEAQVLARSMLEYTITLHWLVEVRDRGVKAVMRLHQRALRNIQETASKGEGMLLPADAIDSVLSVDVPQVDEEDTLRRFEEICAEHGIVHNLYLAYRVMSAVAHPSYSAVAEYVEVDEETGEVTMLRADPPPRAGSAVSWAAHCLVWTGRALDKLLSDRPLRKELQRIARQIETVRVLPERGLPRKRTAKKKAAAKKAPAKKDS
jgi:hypothetical protein